MNVIVKFADEHLREQFVQRLRASDAELLRSYFPAKSMPHAVIENLDAAQAQVVRASAAGIGEVFDDIQFEPFQPRR